MDWIHSLHSIPLPFFTISHIIVVPPHPHRLIKHIPPSIIHGSPITTFVDHNLHIMASPTQIKVFPRATSSATITHAISESETQHLTMNHIAQTRIPGNIVLDWRGIQDLSWTAWSTFDWWLGQAFGHLTASCGQSFPHWLLMVVRIVFKT